MKRTLVGMLGVAGLFLFGAWRVDDPLGTALGMIGFFVGAVALVVAVWWRLTEAAGLDPRKGR